MQIINGKEISNEIKEKLKGEIEENNLTPGLAIVLVGDNPASEKYVKNKCIASEKIGVDAKVYRFSEENTEEEIIECVKKLNADPKVNGIIIQSPIPKCFNEAYINTFISPEKDVDGFGIMNMGYLASNETRFLSATPAGIIELLDHENIPISGANIVVVGRSKIVGRPLSLALLNRDATVTITHSKTKDLASITSKADILIVAIGSSGFITKEFVKVGAVVIDVGTNMVDGKLKGDVNFDDVQDKVSYITPVPGGVGPMTVAMLLKNVVESAKLAKEQDCARKRVK